jgi:hypothetical protein
LKTESRISIYSLYKGVYETELEPSEFSVGQNYPNPFKEKTVIKYCVAYKTRVQITIYNSEGDEIEKLVNEVKKPGTYEVEFYVAQDSSPVKVSSTYYYRLEAGEYKCEKKMQLIK